MRPLFTLLILHHFLPLSAQSGAWTFFAPTPSLTCQAAQGNNVLIGTLGAGIVRFDTLGNRTSINTSNSGIPSDTVTYLAIDAEENWWMIHASGFGRYDGNNTQTWSLAQMGLPSNTFVREMRAAPDTSMYVISDNGVAIFKDDSWSVLNTSNSGLPTNNIWDVAFGPDGKRYYATTGKGVVIQDDTTWTSYTTANTGITQLNNVFSVALTTDGILWAIGGTSPTASIRLAKFEAGTWTGLTAVGIGINQGTFVRKLKAGNAGQLYLTTPTTISILQQGTWTHYRALEIGCSPNIQQAPVEDGAGDIWIFTSCQLARFDGQIWHGVGLNLPGTPPGTLYDGIAEGADGSIWIGTYFGGYITRLKEDGTWEQYFQTNYGVGNSGAVGTRGVTSIQAAPNGAVWFGFENSEILRYANGQWTYFDTCAIPFTDHYVANMATAPNGDQWFSFAPLGGSVLSGLSRLSSDGQWEFFSAANAPLNSFLFIRKIVFEADGTAWFATTHAGILRYKSGVWESFTSSNSGLPSDRVFYLGHATDGAIWACTEAGLVRFDGQNWTVLNTSNSGLPSNITKRIAFDKAGGMYVGYEPEVPGAPLEARVVVLRGGNWTELSPPTMPISSSGPDAFTVDSKNRLWLADYYAPGVHRYDPMLVNTGEPDETSMRIFAAPNPTSGLLTLQLETPLESAANLNVLNSLGQIVRNIIVPQTTGTTIPLDLSGLPAGVYWVRLSLKSGEAVATKVVKR